MNLNLKKNSNGEFEFVAKRPTLPDDRFALPAPNWIKRFRRTSIRISSRSHSPNHWQWHSVRNPVILPSEHPSPRQHCDDEPPFCLYRPCTFEPCRPKHAFPNRPSAARQHSRRTSASWGPSNPIKSSTDQCHRPPFQNHHIPTFQGVDRRILRTRPRHS